MSTNKLNAGVSCVIPTYNGSRDVVECVWSVLNSDYSNIEIIVVDNNSSDSTVKRLKRLFGKRNNFQLIESDANRGAAGGRNLGAKYSKSDYLLFIDNDNVIDKRMISYLAAYFESYQDCGMVGPLMKIKLDPRIIWLYSANINLYTSKASYLGSRQKDVGQYPDYLEVGHVPNCFMVKRKDFENVGGFDEKYFIMYEEADLAEKIRRKLRKKIYIYTKAITLHNAPLKSQKGGNTSRIQLKERAYRTARNKVYFMRRNSNMIQFISFLMIFLPLISAFYIYQAYKFRKIELATYYLKGVFEGFWL